MVEVFKTNVANRTQASTLLDELAGRFPQIKFNFDLSDCDNILRAEGTDFSPASIAEILQCRGFHCLALE